MEEYSRVSTRGGSEQKADAWSVLHIRVGILGYAPSKAFLAQSLNVLKWSR